MSIYKTKYLTLFFAICLLCGPSGWSQVVSLQLSAWTTQLDGTNLTIPSEAGADLNPTIETVSNFNNLSVQNVTDALNWKITISKQDLNWTSSFLPSVQRTSDGTPCGTCAGVNTGKSITGYLQVTDIEQDFLFGTGSVQNINLQFKVDGISLAVPAQNYQTRVIFTLYQDL